MVNRFARNTVDNPDHGTEAQRQGASRFISRKRKHLDTGCLGELLITIMSSLAQEESRSIPEKRDLGPPKRFADGKKVSVPHRHFLGYDKGQLAAIW